MSFLRDRLKLGRSASPPRLPSDQGQVKLKCFLGEECHILVIDREVFNCNTVREKLVGRFGAGAYLHKYEDEQGDWVTVTSDQDMEVALRQYEQQQKRTKTRGAPLKCVLGREGTATPPVSRRVISHSPLKGSAGGDGEESSHERSESSHIPSTVGTPDRERRGLTLPSLVAKEAGAVDNSNEMPTAKKRKSLKKRKTDSLERDIHSLKSARQTKHKKHKSKERASRENSLDLGSMSSSSSDESELGRPDPPRRRHGLTVITSFEEDSNVAQIHSGDDLPVQRPKRNLDSSIDGQGMDSQKPKEDGPLRKRASSMPIPVPPLRTPPHSPRGSPVSLPVPFMPPAVSSPDSHLPPMSLAMFSPSMTNVLGTQTASLFPADLTSPISHLPPVSGEPDLAEHTTDREPGPGNIFKNPPPLASPTSHLSRTGEIGDTSIYFAGSNRGAANGDSNIPFLSYPSDTPENSIEDDTDDGTESGGSGIDTHVTSESGFRTPPKTLSVFHTPPPSPLSISTSAIPDSGDDQTTDDTSSPPIPMLSPVVPDDLRVRLLRHTGWDGQFKEPDPTRAVGNSPVLVEIEDMDSDEDNSDSGDEETKLQPSEDWSNVSWKKGKQLGSGGFGSVFEGLKEDGGLFAVKMVPLQPSPVNDITGHLLATEKEIEVMRGLHHRNIVQYLGTVQRDQMLHIFLEYVPGGSIATLLSRFGALAESTVAGYTRQILQGLAYLHRNNIIHRDIKGANILVHTDGTVKLADFGCSRRFDTTLSCFVDATTVIGTPQWMAPEIIRQLPYGRAADVWSLGCTVIEMLTARPPWSECSNVAATLYSISASQRLPDFPPELSPAAFHFLQQCFDREAERRPSATSLLRHPFTVVSGASAKRTGRHKPTDKKKKHIKQKRSGAKAPKKLHGTKPRNDLSMFSLLPKDTILKILSCLDSQNIDNAAIVCKYWNILVLELWERRCTDRWSCYNFLQSKRKYMGKMLLNWRALYIHGEKQIKKWATSATVPVSSLKGHNKTVYCVRWLNSSTVVSGSDDKKIKVWEYQKAKWKCSHTIKGHGEGVYSLAIMNETGIGEHEADQPNGPRLLASGSLDQTIRLWNTQRYRNVRTINNAHPMGVSGLQFEGTLLASCSLSDGYLCIWDVETGKLVANIPGHERGIFSIAWRGNVLVSGAADQIVKVWDIRDGSLVRSLQGHDDEVTVVRLDWDADTVLSASADTTIRRWDIGTGLCSNIIGRTPPATPTLLGPHTQGIWGLVEQGGCIISGAQDSNIKCWDEKTGGCVQTWMGGGKASVYSLEMQDGMIASAGKDRMVRIRSVGAYL